MRNKSILILEIIWLITGFLCLAAGTRMLVESGFSKRVLLFGLMALVSFLFALMRHRQRKKN